MIFLAIAFPPFIKSHFGPRLQRCLSLTFEIHPLNSSCLNVYEIILLAIVLIALLFAALTSSYFVAMSVKSFKRIYRNFLVDFDEIDDLDRWPSRDVRRRMSRDSPRFPAGWVNHTPPRNKYHTNITPISPHISSDRMSFY